MMRSHVWVVVAAAMLSGWFARAQGPGFSGYPSPQTEMPNPKGVPAPIAPDAKLRPADPFAVPPPQPPEPSGPGGMRYGYPPGRQIPASPGGTPQGYPNPGMMMPMRPGMMPYGYPMMSMPPGTYPGMTQFPPTPTPLPGQQFVPPTPTPLPGQQFVPPMPTPAPGQPFVPPMPTPLPGQQFVPPMPTPVPGQPFVPPTPTPVPGQQFLPPMPTPLPRPGNGGQGQPYMVPQEPEKLPSFLPPIAAPVAPPSPLSPEFHAPPPETQAVSYMAPTSPSLPREPYVLYEGGRSQKGLLSCEVQSGYCVWGSVEYLYWWSKNSPAPPALATTSPAGAPAFIAGSPRGALGRADTTVVLGGQSLELPSRTGARFTVGAWLDPEQTLGVEANYFFLAARNQTQSVNSNGGVNDVGLFIPFLDVNPANPGEDSKVVANGAGFGSAALTFSSQLQGAEVNSLFHLVQWYGLNVNVLAGFRYLNLWEELDLTTTQPGPLAGQFVNTFDQFKTKNNFYGGQLGVRADYQYHWFFVNATTKLAYGNMVETVTIDGRTTTNLTTVPGGIFAQPTNIGQYSRNRDAFLSEGTLNAGVQVWNWLRIFGGYNFIYVNHVARPGDQIDRSINSSQTSFNGAPGGPLVGPANPAFTFRDSSYWVNGLNIGLEVRY